MNARNILVVLITAAIAIGGLTYWINQPGPPPVDGSSEWGTFEGTPSTSWDANGRDMTLQRDFAYVDASGKRWLAHKGAVVNGASIPQPLWTFIGGPFEGPYRNASIVHDVYCESMSEPRTRRCHPRGADGFEALSAISGPEGRHIVSRCA